MAFVHDHSDNFGLRRNRRPEPKQKRKTLTQYLREAMEERKETKMKEQNSVGLYNTDAVMWNNSMDSYRQRGIKLIVAEGHVIAGADGIVARFRDDAHAVATLEAACYVREPSEVNVIFRPQTVAELMALRNSGKESK